MGGDDVGEPQAVVALRAAILAAVEGGRSLRDLARQADAHIAGLSLFVRGKRDLKLTTAGRLAGVLGLELVTVRKPKGGRKASGTRTSAGRR